MAIRRWKQLTDADVRNIVISTISFLILSACQTTGGTFSSYDGLKPISKRQNYSLSENTSIVRAGNSSQRFEIRHGDCGSEVGWSDCTNDRQRIERFRDNRTWHDNVVWYGFSVFLPRDFQDIAPSNTMLGQVKLNRYRQPIWNFYASYGSFYFEGNASRQRCVVADQRRMLGAWTDIVLGADYSLAVKTGAFGGNFIKIIVNGKNIRCSVPRPILTTKMMSNSGRSDGKMHFDWGIYNSYVSRWLNRHKTKAVKVDTFVDDHKDSGLVVRSSTQRPFEVDWGVKLPTQVVYYDEMRWGPERKDVDIRLMEATANYVPVD